MKFIPCDAEGINPLIAQVPLMTWDCTVTSASTSSMVFGVTEIAIAMLIAIRPLWPKVSAIGSLFAAVLFLTTITLLFSTSGRQPSLRGFPAIVVPGQILLKNVVLLGAALSSAGEAWEAAQVRPRVKSRIHQDVAS
jgi:reactive chlorine resistance protein C